MSDPAGNQSNNSTYNDDSLAAQGDNNDSGFLPPSSSDGLAMSDFNANQGLGNGTLFDSDPLDVAGVTIDENGSELTSPFLPRTSNNLDSNSGGGNGRVNNDSSMSAAERFATAAAQPHSGFRLVVRKLGNLVAAITLVAMAIFVPVVTYRALQKRKLDTAAYNSAFVMVVGTIVLSIRLVYLHFKHWHMPKVQKYVIRIVWMVPLYAIQSWLSLVFRDARIYIDTVRDLYEAYVIASFVYYLIELLGGQDNLVAMLREKAANPDVAHHLGSHTFPVNLFLKPWELGMEFMLQCKHGVLQYVVVKAIGTVLIFIFQSLHCYGEGQFHWGVAYPYMAFILNSSVMYALYCLVKLFHAVNEELRRPIDWHPLGKFLCVKGVVFFTWWQGVVIYYLQSHGFIDDVGGWTGEEVANGLIDYCVCIEMVGFAIAHSYTFTYTEYLPETVNRLMRQNSVDLDGNNLDGSESYRPPEVHPHPASVRSAFVSSTFPSETFQDIRRLRKGVKKVIDKASEPGTISLQDMSASGTSTETTADESQRNNNIV